MTRITFVKADPSNPLYTHNAQAVWDSPVAEIEIRYMDLFMESANFSILPRRNNFSRVLRVVNKDWRFWRLYYCYDWVCLQIILLRENIYYWLYKHGHLTTKEGCIPSWRDISLVKISKDLP